HGWRLAHSAFPEPIVAVGVGRRDGACTRSDRCDAANRDRRGPRARRRRHQGRLRPRRDHRRETGTAGGGGGARGDRNRAPGGGGNENGVPVTGRGSGTGLSGSVIPAPGSVVVSFEHMNRVLEIDEENHVAVVQPGLTLAELDEVTAAHALVYPVFPGEYSAS